MFDSERDDLKSIMQMRVRANVVPLPAQSLPTQAGFVLPTFDTLRANFKRQVYHHDRSHSWSIHSTDGNHDGFDYC